jgi:hypothetical protein
MTSECSPHTGKFRCAYGAPASPGTRKQSGKCVASFSGQSVPSESVGPSVPNKMSLCRAGPTAIPSRTMFWRNPAAKRRPPGFIEPCIPTCVSKPPVGPQWIHEIKHDGYRLFVRKQGDRVRLFGRMPATTQWRTSWRVSASSLSCLFRVGYL